MDGGRAITGCRLVMPSLRDFAWVAEHMRPDEIEQFTAKTGAPYSADVCARAMAAATGPVFGLIDPAGFPIAVGGFEALRPGVYELWAAGTVQGWERHWRAITLACGRLIRRMFASGAHRVQIVALESRASAHDWYERALGLRREGLHPGWYANGETGITFARTR